MLYSGSEYTLLSGVPIDTVENVILFVSFGNMLNEDCDLTWLSIGGRNLGGNISEKLLFVS